MQRQATDRRRDFKLSRSISRPLPEQRRIVGILDEAFAGIATAKANAEKNLQNAHALFESHLQSVFTQRGKGWKIERWHAKSLKKSLASVRQMKNRENTAISIPNI